MGNFLFKIAFLTLISTNAFALCQPQTHGSCTQQGASQWDSTNNTQVVCNGTDWISTASTGSLGSCSGEGKMEFDSGINNYKYCQAGNWYAFAKSGSLGPCTKLAERDYDTTNKVMKWCDGTKWIIMAKEANIAIGQSCVDNTIYAGITPDGNVRMYTTKCDRGQTWNGSACTGTRTTRSWNNGNGLGLQVTGATSTTDGDGNTITVAAADADIIIGGVQPHLAAVDCDSLNFDGRTDWYLPARDEIAILYTNRAAIGNFTTASYWSSTEVGLLTSYATAFNTGIAGATGKATAANTRCVRQDL